MKSSPGKFFLVTDFLELGSSARGGSGQHLAAKLAKLHTTPAPTPEGFDKPMFGFPVPTCCGSTVQDNTWTESWADFYAHRRIRAIFDEAERNNGGDRDLAAAVDKIAGAVVPRLLGDGHLRGVRPVVVHGDLWSGNHSRGRIAGKGGAEEVVYDPSCVYGHSEYDLGIMRMFGGFGRSFWKEYEELVPKAEPKEEWEDRIALYELWVNNVFRRGAFYSFSFFLFLFSLFIFSFYISHEAPRTGLTARMQVPSLESLRYIWRRVSRWRNVHYAKTDC